MMSKCRGDDDEDDVYSIEILVVLVIAVIIAIRQIIVRIVRLVQLETDEGRPGVVQVRGSGLARFTAVPGFGDSLRLGLKCLEV